MLANGPAEKVPPPPEAPKEHSIDEGSKPAAPDKTNPKYDPAEIEKALKARIDWLIEQKKRDGKI